jgi:diphthine synthase
MLEAEDVMKKNAYNKNTKCFALSRIGFSNQKIKSGTLEQILNEDMGEPLHSLLLCADELHCIE